MPQLFPIEVIQHSKFAWVPKVRVKSQIIYTSVLLAIVAAIVAMPFIKVDVSVKASGLVRPIAEKNELRSLLPGTIEEVYVTDGQQVVKGQPILRLQEDISNSKLSQTSFDLSQKEVFVHDLQLLSAGRSSGLKSAMYQQQYQRFIASLSEQKATLAKLKADYDVSYSLYRDKVIAYKEYTDRRYEFEKAQASYESLVQQQRSVWAEELNRYQQETNRLSEDKKQQSKEKERNTIVAPVSGTLQQFNGKYTGGALQAGELLGYISPDANIVAECYVSPKDIGYLKVGMPVKFQVDAFNYNEWGVVEGKVMSIDNDFITADKEPVFRVKCNFANTMLQLRNGVKGNLKKGMTLQARFILTKRSLFQLLYDRTDKWLNPNAA
ncbi:HlyD family secretion protein [Chitinophaga skermanii]|uniref:HlyD family secretion protein n=1 Tax=Chitinophaga skermanii TaxID=331697 RepID=A0A327QYU2_9BACT|nr:HlyD family efflux transporter periplasmic adaptor subunit [Chitinophaga skermanii]RAJ06827.1 HlyD family secretion protein [Chitinophaga skermanii]